MFILDCLEEFVIYVLFFYESLYIKYVVVSDVRLYVVIDKLSFDIFVFFDSSVWLRKTKYTE